MSLCTGIATTVSNSVLDNGAEEGYGSGLDLIKTLQAALALGTRNSTILPKPSSCKDSAALWYSVSAMDLDDRLPCLKACRRPQVQVYTVCSVSPFHSRAVQWSCHKWYLSLP